MRVRRHGLRVTRRARKPRDPAAASQPEDRNPLDRLRELEPVHQLGVEAWDGKAGDGVHHQRGHVLEPDASIGKGRESHLFQEGQRVTLEHFGARFPAMALVIPVLRLTRVASLDAGI